MPVWVCVINLPAVNLQPSIHTFRPATVAHGRLAAARVCVCVCLFWRWRSACCSVQHLNHWVSVATTLEKCACVWQREQGWWVRSSVSDSFSLTTMETMAHKHPWVCVLTHSVKRQAACCVYICVCVCAQLQQMLGDLADYSTESQSDPERTKGRKFTWVRLTHSERKNKTNICIYF